MKRIIIITGLILFLYGMFSCQNQEREFPDFDYTTAYFPYQTPVRTLVLGDFYYDNTLDNNLQFLIGAAMGGVHENKENRTVNFTVDVSLLQNAYFNTAGTLPVLALPSNYYTLSDNSTIVIPSGELWGSVKVQLADAFLDDPLSISNNYVIPLRITDASTDSVLSGKSNYDDPDRRVAGDWVIVPQDYTLYGIKYVNPYSGKYLMKGKNVIRNEADNTLIETNVYRSQYVEQCEITTVTTTAKDSVSYQNNIRMSGSSPGVFKIKIGFDASGNGTIVTDPTSAFDVTGNAKYVRNDGFWGGLERNVIYLNFSITEGGRIHTCTDTLTFRDKAITLETFNVYIVEP